MPGTAESSSAANAGTPAERTDRIVVEARLLLEAVQIEIGGLHLWVRAEPRARRWDESVVRPIVESDEYELRPLRDAGQQLRTVLDIGAHLGAFTCLVKSTWPAARVIAAEPDPESAALLRRNTADLSAVELFAGAVIGRPGVHEVQLRQGGANDDRNAAASRLPAVVEPLAPERGPLVPTALAAAVDILDLLDRRGNPEIDLLKLDCEGAEGEILERLAASGRMRRIGWIRGEWHFDANLPRIEAALAPTHIFNLQRGDAPWGAFIAHRKPGLGAG